MFCTHTSQGAVDEVSSTGAKPVIFETDMTFDVDDVGALAMLNALADRGEVHIVAVMYNEVHEAGAEAIAAINTWYGRGEIPIGIYRKDLSRPDDSRYLSAIAGFRREPASPISSDAQDLYRETLGSAADNSITIVSVGFLNNLADLLRNDRALIERKVNELILMGGLVNDSFNFVRHELVEESQFVLENWPTRLVVTDFGGSVRTGTELFSTPEENPVREAYFRWFSGSFKGRSSWDQVSVLYAVRGLGENFELVTEGEGRLRNGYTWSLNEIDRHYLKPKLSTSHFERVIEELMKVAPATK